MKPLCLVPWTNIDIGPNGNIIPCCEVEVPETENMNIQKNTIQDYVNSDRLKNMKQQMLNHEWPEQCIVCKNKEEANIKSKRQLDYERWQESFDNYREEQGFLTACISFGNTCNLKCVTCDSVASTRWRKEYIDIFGIDNPPNKFTDYDIYTSLPNLLHLDIGAGEPFLSEVEKQIKLLQKYVDSGHSKNMTLHYNTNAQAYPNSKYWELFQHFKQIDLQLSIDGIYDRFEYIRYPGKYSLLEEIIDQYLEKRKQCKNIKLSVSHTVSAFSVYYLEEFFWWCIKKGLPKPWCGIVRNPKYMRPCVFKPSIKEKIMKKLKDSRIPDIQNWGQYLATHDSSQYYKKFLQMRDVHDKYRNTSFSQTFPEVQELILEG